MRMQCYVQYTEPSVLLCALVLTGAANWSYAEGIQQVWFWWNFNIRFKGSALTPFAIPTLVGMVLFTY